MHWGVVCPMCLREFSVVEVRGPVGIKCPECDAELTFDGCGFLGKSSPQIRVRVGYPPSAAAYAALETKHQSDSSGSRKSSGSLKRNHVGFPMTSALLAGLVTLLISVGGLAAVGYFLFTNTDASDDVAQREPAVDMPTWPTPITQPINPVITKPPPQPKDGFVLRPLGGTIPGMHVSTSMAPLSAEQWAEIESLRTSRGIREFHLLGPGIDDAFLAKLVKFDPVLLQLSGCPVTDAGVAHLAGMKSLRTLHMSGCQVVTAKSAAIVANHPTIENLLPATPWTNDAATLAEILKNSRIKALTLGADQARDTNCVVIARHASLEILSLRPEGHTTATLTDDALVSLATLPKLKKLEVYHGRFTYEGGLSHLKNVPTLATLHLLDVVVSEEDLERLKTDLPKVEMKYTPMKSEYRAKFEQWEAAWAMANELEKHPQAARAEKLAEIQKSDPALFRVVNAELWRRRTSPKK